MKTIETTVYTFDELSDSAKETARNWFREASAYDDWWDYIYEDAANVDLTLDHFDIGRRRQIGMKFATDPETTAHKILDNHGTECDTYKTAKRFLDNLPEDTEEREDFEDTKDMEDAIGDFHYDLKTAYFRMLEREYDYINSDEHVDECIRMNEYTFTENGHQFG